jgi:valyl-tRNA synthetase
MIVCSKSGDVIEPVLKPQWWVNCKPLADEAVKVPVLCATESHRRLMLVLCFRSSELGQVN